MAKSIFNLPHQNEDLTSKIVVGLERIAETFRSLLWDHAKEIGLSPIQIQSLIYIAHHDISQATISLLASEFQVTKATMSDAIKRLVEKDFLRKIPSLSDKRTYTLKLTTSGKSIVKRTEHFANPLKDVVNRLGPNQQQEFYKAIYSVIHGAQKHGLINAQRMCFNCRFYRRKQNRHYCQYLKSMLATNEIRIDCPEFESI